MKSFMNSFKDPLNIFLAIFCLILLFYVLGMYKEGLANPKPDDTPKLDTTSIDGDKIVNIIFIGDNGNSGQIIYKDKKYVLIIINEIGKKNEYTYSPTITKTNDDKLPSIVYNAKFVGKDGDTATLFKFNDGYYMIELNMPNGSKNMFISKMTDNVDNKNQLNSRQNYMNFPPMPFGFPPPPFGIPPPPSYVPPPQSYDYSNQSNQPYGSPPQSYDYLNQPPQSYGGSSQSYNYSNDLPPGIPSSKIPPGEEDLYILKSEIVPPVCPACPSPVPCIKNKTDSCAPCPPCGRCPEPNFECKKVPNYSSSNYDIPDAILAPYSTFGS